MFLRTSRISNILPVCGRHGKDLPARKLRERCRDGSGNTEPDEEQRRIQIDLLGLPGQRHLAGESFDPREHSQAFD